MPAMNSTALPRSAALALSLAIATPVNGAREVFQTPKNGPTLGVWRITNDPPIRGWANYHNTQCWSPDGRFLRDSHLAPDLGRFGDHSIKVHLRDLHRDESRLIERGFFPRWAKSHNWLFYVRIG